MKLYRIAAGSYEYDGYRIWRVENRYDRSAFGEQWHVMKDYGAKRQDFGTYSTLKEARKALTRVLKQAAVVIALALLPVVAHAELIQYDFQAAIGGTGGLFVGQWTVDTNAASIGNSTLRDGGQLYGVVSSNVLVMPNYFNAKYGGEFPTAFGSATNYCSGYCVFLTYTDRTVLNYEAGPYKGRLIFTPGFAAYQPSGSDVGYFQPTDTFFASVGFGLPTGTLKSTVLQAAAVPEPETVWLFLGGIGLIVVLLTWQEARRP